MSLNDIVLTGGSFCAANTQMIDKILAVKDPDAALLYLYILRHPENFNEANAKKVLGFDAIRLERAVFSLVNLNVITSPSQSKKQAPMREHYSMKELRSARHENLEFSAVCQTGEAVLGRVLTESQLRTLYVAYDELKLPADVLIELLSYLKSQKDNVTRKDIEQEIYLWADMGIFDCALAGEYIKRNELLKPLRKNMQIALKIDGRTLTAKETALITRFIDMGFNADVVELALDRTQNAIGKFSWNYINKILEDFHKKNAHTMSEIEALGLSDYKKPEPIKSSGLSDWEKQWLSELNMSSEVKTNE